MPEPEGLINKILRQGREKKEAEQKAAEDAKARAAAEAAAAREAEAQARREAEGQARVAAEEAAKAAEAQAKQAADAQSAVEEEERMRAEEAAEKAAARQMATEKTVAAAQREYVVEPGDSLWQIAQSQLGDGSRWPEIYELNKAVIGDNPNLIQPGQKYILPK